MTSICYTPNRISCSEGQKVDDAKNSRITNQAMITKNLLTSLAAGILVAGTAVHADLVGYWTLDGNFEDSSGNNNHGTLVGG
ncbi:MAG: hypothetical protein GWO24_32360, partial [Akkermansiaceae bacterium]|nr:hypothetical protein [Akkermansiaceae bacterium]